MFDDCGAQRRDKLLRDVARDVADRSSIRRAACFLLIASFSGSRSPI
jgi:hypothetical protein